MDTIFYFALRLRKGRQLNCNIIPFSEIVLEATHQQIGECKNGGNKKTKAHQIIKKTNISYSLTRTGSGKWYINKDRIVIKINLKIFNLFGTSAMKVPIKLL